MGGSPVWLLFPDPRSTPEPAYGLIKKALGKLLFWRSREAKEESGRRLGVLRDPKRREGGVPPIFFQERGRPDDGLPSEAVVNLFVLEFQGGPWSGEAEVEIESNWNNQRHFYLLHPCLGPPPLASECW